MTFTADEQEKIHRYFGYPAATGWIHQIQNFCNRMSEASAEAEETARALIQQIDQLDLRSQQAKQFGAKTSQSETEGIAQNVFGEQMNTLKRDQASLVQELSELLELPVHREIFGSGGCQPSRRHRRG